MTNPRIKRLRNPTFPASDLDAALGGINPVLLKGEIVCLYDTLTGKVTGYKIGDGVNRWDQLAFQNDAEYPHLDLVTNQIGDIIVGTQINGRPLSDIILDMVSPYQAPAVSNVRTNADGVNFLTTSILEIGQSLSTAITVTFDVSNQSNLVVDPVTIDTFGFFAEFNPYPNSPISITPQSPLAPTSPTVYQLRIKVTHTNGDSAWVFAYIRFDTRLIWGASPLADLTTTQHALDLIAQGGGEGVKPDYFDDYILSAAGYGYVLIPSVLLAGAPPVVWTEISNPLAPASIGMVNMGTLSVNNGVGTYNYEKYRTPFLNLEGVILKAQ